MPDKSPTKSLIEDDSDLLQKSCVSVDRIDAVKRWNDHDGQGPIMFRRILGDADFRAPVDFVDYTIVPAGSSIGRHEHLGNEELYFIVSGEPLMRINGNSFRLQARSISVVHSGEWHELVNDTLSNVEILVIQVHLP